MCRNIKTLFNFDPPATEDEIRAASLQFIRKISGSARPSKANAKVFDRAVEDVAVIVNTLVDSLVTSGTPKNREVEAARSRARIHERLGSRQNEVPEVI